MPLDSLDHGHQNQIFHDGKKERNGPVNIQKNSIIFCGDLLRLGFNFFAGVFVKNSRNDDVPVLIIKPDLFFRKFDRIGF